MKKRNVFKSKFDLIFCAPPFRDSNIEKLIRLIFDKHLLKKNGIVCSPSAINGKNNEKIDLFNLRRFMPNFMKTKFPL